MPTSDSSSLTPRIDRHLLGCAAIASLSMLSPDATADIVFTTFAPITIPDGYTLMLDFGPTSATMKTKLVTKSLVFYPTYEVGINYYSTTPYYYNYAKLQTAGSFTVELLSSVLAGPPTKFASGATIDAVTSFATSTLTTFFYDFSIPSSYGEWAGGGYGFVGVMFTKGAYKYYGWISLYISSDASVSKVTGFAWEDIAGKAIIAGAVPEPGAMSLAALALGAAGVAACRRRRREEAEVH